MNTMLKTKQYTLTHLLKDLKNLLKRANIISYSLDADMIVAHALSITREKLISEANNIIVDDIQYKNIIQLINRRLNNEPVAYIVGEKSFWNSSFKVTGDTLIPRPDTEILVEAVIEHIKNTKFNFQYDQIRILDIGTGTGCILIALIQEVCQLHTDVIGVGIDITSKAIEVAMDNARCIGLDINKVIFVNQSWEDFVKSTKMRFDIIVSNPPYISSNDITTLISDVKDYEPHIALDGGEDGLMYYRQIIHLMEYVSRDNTLIAFELGIGQAHDVAEIMHANAIEVIKIIKDISGVERVIVGIKK